MEYAIWGKTRFSSDEQLLITKYKGAPITDRAIASDLKQWAETQGASDVRVQEIDFSTPPDFSVAYYRS